MARWRISFTGAQADLSQTHERRLHQARIQDLAQGGARAKRGPKVRGSQGQWPQGTPFRKPKSLGFGPLPGPVHLFIFLFFLSYFFPLGAGARPPCPPPPPLDTSLVCTHQFYEEHYQ